jgi:hypothetical protein
MSASTDGRRIAPEGIRQTPEIRVESTGFDPERGIRWDARRRRPPAARRR